MLAATVEQADGVRNQFLRARAQCELNRCHHICCIEDVAECWQGSGHNDPVTWKFEALAMTRNRPGEPEFPSEDVEAIRATIMEWKEHQWRSQTAMLDHQASMQASDYSVSDVQRLDLQQRVWALVAEACTTYIVQYGTDRWLLDMLTFALH